VKKRPSRRTRETAPAADAIALALAKAGVTEEVRTHRIITEWRDMVGERIATRTWPDGLKDRTLWIRVASSAWLHELTLLRAQILDGITRVLGEPRLVDELRFHLGSRKQVDADDVLAIAQQARMRRRRPPQKPLPAPATGAAAAQIERETGAIADPELRELIRAVRVRHDR
jgi:predicted nucleic acid-binding Zn ribbon protein